MWLIGQSGDWRDRSVHPLSSLKSDGCAKVCEPCEDYCLRLQCSSSNDCTSFQDKTNLTQTFTAKLELTEGYVQNVLPSRCSYAQTLLS